MFKTSTAACVQSLHYIWFVSNAWIQQHLCHCDDDDDGYYYYWEDIHKVHVFR